MVKLEVQTIESWFEGVQMAGDQRTFEERQEAMARAAGELLREEGPAAVTHRRVATRAGVAQGSAAHLIRTHNELYAAAVDYAEKARHQAARDLQASLPEQIEPLRETARLLIIALYSQQNDEDLVRFRAEPMLLAAMDSALRPAVMRTEKSLRSVMRTILERGGLGASAVIDVIPEIVLGVILRASMMEESGVVETAIADLERILSQLAIAAEASRP